MQRGTTRTSFSRENDLGSSQVGPLADLLVLDRDYFTVQADEVEGINPVMTVVGGRAVFDAATEQSAAGQ